MKLCRTEFLLIVSVLLCSCIAAVVAHADDDPALAATLEAQRARIAAIDKAKVSAISVFANGGNGGGSGVVITPDGYALSNYHVTKPAGTFMKCSMPDGKLYDAVIVGIDPTGDVAMIKLFGRDDFPHAELGDSDLVKPGDWCFAIGNPFLLATNFEPTVTFGMVSGTHRYQYPAGTLLEYADCIQTDASINPGNSGGPLFNARGQLIGINGRGSFEKRGRVNVGVGYAISINQIKNFMGYLRSGRIVDHATLGASVAAADDGTVTVTNILETCDAYRRGLRYDDEIIAFGGREITTANGFKNALGIFPKGWRVPLSFRRDGTRYDVVVRLQGVHAGEELIEKIQGKPKGVPIDGPGPGDDDKPKDEPGQIVLPKPGPKAPAHLVKYHKARRGYMNYYFNELNRDRVWNASEDGGSFSGLAGEWLLKGETADGRNFEFKLADDSVTGDFAGEAVSIDLDKDLDAQLSPAGSGGLLAALHLWRRMLVRGPTGYGSVYYLGTGPTIDRAEMVDILVGTHGVTESRFLFSPETGRMVAVEMFADVHADPCEILLKDYQQQNGRWLPHTIDVRFGDQKFAVMQLTEITLPEN